MSVKIIDYVLDNLEPANADATHPATVAGCTITAGPGVTIFGDFPLALDFRPNGRASSTLSASMLSAKKFCIRVLFRIDDAVGERQELVRFEAFSAMLSVTKGTTDSRFNLVASVITQETGTGRASTEFLEELDLGAWYTADLVYDTDTLALFVDGGIRSVYAFPDGAIDVMGTDRLLIGVFNNSGDGQFLGMIAALQVHDDIPIELEAQLDDMRSHPQWYLTRKEAELRSSLLLGQPSAAIYHDFDSSCWIQEFPAAILMYHDSNGVAFELHGAILKAYRQIPNRTAIGYPVSDEIDAAKNGSRKNLFSRGGIYWSASTGAVPVLDQIWVDYESMGEAHAIGLPLSVVHPMVGGWMQEFELAQMYWKSSEAQAFEIHGQVLSKYLSTGGLARWGFPVSRESDLLSGAATIGRICDFEHCTIYSNASLGAFESHGFIRDAYRNAGGPAGPLGFPTSDEADIPNATGPARYNTFENGSIVSFGSINETYVCFPFDMTLGRIDTVESEGLGRGENDVYVLAIVEDGNSTLFSKRLPGRGDSDDNNILELNLTLPLGAGGIVPNDPGRIIKLVLDVWDSDWPEGDDYLGHFETVLRMENAWGLRGNPSGIFSSGPVDDINSITWSVSPRIDEALLVESNKWWGVKNISTDTLSYAQYAAAFSDVDSDSEWWDVTDWLDALFYETVIEDCADEGNCFGMSLEAIYSKKHRSILRLPLDRFTDWEKVRNEFNIRHQYQFGAPAIWWFVGEFLSGETHDPVSVFNATRAAYERGCDPVLCMAQHYDFSGEPHVVLQIGWDDSTKPWRIFVHDPNFPSLQIGDPGPRVVNVDPDANTFSYHGVYTYTGGSWSGGRMYYMPYSRLSERPRTPVFEAIMLIVTGVIIILGSDSETSGLTDENGIDLDAFGPDSVNRLKAGKSLRNKFVSVKGFGSPRGNRRRESAGHGGRTDSGPPARGILPSEVHMRAERKEYSRIAPSKPRTDVERNRLTLGEFLDRLAPASVRERFARHPDFVVANRHRRLYSLAEMDVVKDITDLAKLKTPLKQNPYPPVSRNFRHTIRGVRAGRLEYAVKEASMQLLLTAETNVGEEHTIRITDLCSSNNTIKIKGTPGKTFSLHVHIGLGVGRDYLRMTVDRIPLSASGELKLSVKPGIGGLEAVSPGQTMNATVSLEYSGGGKSLARKFLLNHQDGFRLIPSTFLTSDQLKVSQIDKLFGESLGSVVLDALP